MNRLLSILEEKQQPQEECIDADKLHFIASKISFWDFFRISQAQYLVFDKTEKSRMLNEYYSKLVVKYFGDGKNFFCLKK